VFYGQSPWWFSLWFVQDEAIDLIDREVVTWSDVISDFGGILEIVVVLTGIIVSGVTEYGYYCSLISKVFLEEVEDK